MTTIVYHQGIIAADSRMTAGDLITSDDYNKFTGRDGVFFALSGETPSFPELIKAYFGEPHDKDINAAAIIVDNNTVYHSSVDDNDKFWKSEVTGGSYCLGSGKWHAWTAIDMGCTAKEAVKMAMKRDIYTGGKIRIYRVNGQNNTI